MRRLVALVVPLLVLGVGCRGESPAQPGVDQQISDVESTVDAIESDLAVLVAESARVWRSRCAAAGVTFSVEAPAGEVVVRTDPRRLRQVVDGLAENAVRATPAGAPVVLALRAGPGVAVLEVRDGGPGLSDDDYRTAFDRGVLHSRYQGIRPVGTGIGLALAHGLVTRLGGRIDAGPAREAGRGSA